MRKKLQKFVQNSTNPKVIRLPFDHDIPHKGRRADDFFMNSWPLSLELGCGKGEYTDHFSSLFEKNYIGIDLKSDRFADTAQRAVEKTNIAFLWGQIESLSYAFAPGEVDEIRIVHPDPQPNKERKRLTCPRFLSLYKQLLIPGGVLSLKTDDRDFFDYSLLMFRQEGWNITASTYDLYTSPLHADHYGVVTRYERKHVSLGKTICYATCTSPA